jgi:hypothetical protein
MITKITKIQFYSQADSFVWNLHFNGKFLVASLYNAMLMQANYPHMKTL